MNMNDEQRSAVATELEQVSIEAYNVPREDLRATTFVGRQEGVKEWAEAWIFPIYSKTGIAKFVADFAQDLPPVNSFLKKEAVVIKTIADAYSYSEEEIMAWLTGASGRDIDRERSTEAKRAIDEKVDRVIIKGDDEAGYTGLINNANVSTTTAASTIRAAATLDDVVAIFQAGLNVVKANTTGPNGGACIKADTFILPTSEYNYLATKKVPDTAETYLDYLKRVFASQGVKNWYEHEALEGAGASSSNRLIAYKNDKSVISYVLPIPFKQKTAQEKALSYNVPCFARCGGVVFKRVKAFAYVDGV